MYNIKDRFKYYSFWDEFNRRKDFKIKNLDLLIIKKPNNTFFIDYFCTKERTLEYKDISLRTFDFKQFSNYNVSITVYADEINYQFDCYVLFINKADLVLYKLKE